MRSFLVLLTLAACAWAEEGGHEASPSMLWTWVNFGVVALILGYIAVKTGGPALRERAAEILESLSAAAQRSEAAAKKAAEIDLKMASLGTQVEALRQEARAEMARDAAGFQAETVELIAKVERNAEAEIAAAAKHAQNALKVFSAELAIELANKKIAARVDPETQARLVDGFVRSLN